MITELHQMSQIKIATVSGSVSVWTWTRWTSKQKQEDVLEQQKWIRISTQPECKWIIWIWLWLWLQVYVREFSSLNHHHKDDQRRKNDLTTCFLRTSCVRQHLAAVGSSGTCGLLKLATWASFNTSTSSIGSTWRDSGGWFPVWSCFCFCQTQNLT